MDLSARFDRWFEKLPASPRDVGRLHRIVVRPPGAEGRRETPESVEATPEGGLVGDKWSTVEPVLVEAQVSLINTHVLRSLAGDEERMALSGDNLQVDLDLTEENLPPGSRLTIGTVTLEVTPLPHTPCASFLERFGKRAAKRVARATRVGRRGRGVLCRVVTAGAMRRGDEVRVERPRAD
jgi:MOSC domain-containing protein YiiM